MSSLQSHHSTATEFVTEASKAVPPVAVSGMVFAGMSLQEWVLVATLIYTVLQIATLVRKFFKDRKA